MPTLTPFDPAQPLEAKTFIRLRGDILKKGDAVEYKEADHRVLNRLYEQRKIGYGKGEPVEARTPRETFLAGNTERRVADKKADAQIEKIEAANEQEQADALVAANTKPQLLELAGPREGEDALDVTDKQTKGEIALALVRAGRGTA